MLTGKVDGLEGEVSAEMRRSRLGKTHKGQFSIPIDPEENLRGLMYPDYQTRTDLTTTSGALGRFSPSPTCP